MSDIKKRLDEIERRMMPKPERDEEEFFEYCTADSVYDHSKTLAENLADAEFPDDVLPGPVQKVEA